MSTPVTWNLEWRIAGVLTDATSVVLADATDAYGVRRADTQAVVVAAGTAMTRTATGKYSITFTPPADGLTLEYAPRVVYGGNTYQLATITVNPDPPANGAYLTASQARALATGTPGQPGLSTLLALDDLALAGLLLLASIDIDHAMPYQGTPYDTTGAQERAFPRATSDGQVLDWDSATSSAIVPSPVKLACLYQAAWLTDAANTARIEAIRAGLASQSIGSLSESYQSVASIPGLASSLCDRAARLMDRYRLRGGGLL